MGYIYLVFAMVIGIYLHWLLWWWVIFTLVAMVMGYIYIGCYGDGLYLHWLLWWWGYIYIGCYGDGDIFTLVAMVMGIYLHWLLWWLGYIYIVCYGDGDIFTLVAMVMGIYLHWLLWWWDIFTLVAMVMGIYLHWLLWWWGWDIFTLVAMVMGMGYIYIGCYGDGDIFTWFLLWWWGYIYIGCYGDGRYLPGVCYGDGDIFILVAMVMGDIYLVFAMVMGIYLYWLLWFVGLVCWNLTSLCHSNGHIEIMPAREINPSILPWPGFDPSFSGHNIGCYGDGDIINNNYLRCVMHFSQFYILKEWNVIFWMPVGWIHDQVKPTIIIR